MKNLITGGAGFIGSHLTERILSETEDTVVIYDTFSSGALGNIEHLSETPRITVVDGNILEKEELKQVARNTDRIYHLAAVAGVGNVVSDPVKTLRVNIDGTRNVLAAAAENSTPTFIPSTSDIYGKSPDVPFTEDGDRLMGPITVPRWAYANAKALDEYFAQGYNRKHGLPVVIGRPFNIAGPRQLSNPGTVIPTFVKHALDDEPISVYGDGTQTRSFTHIDDAVRAIHRLMTNKETYGDTYNIGTEGRISMLELAETIVNRTNSNSTIETVPYEEVYDREFEDPPHKEPDISKLQATIDYEPRNSLVDIVDDVIEWVQSD
jgi:UDP-glucose 4-epimerase